MLDSEVTRHKDNYSSIEKLEDGGRLSDIHSIPRPDESSHAKSIPRLSWSVCSQPTNESCGDVCEGLALFPKKPDSWSGATICKQVLPLADQCNCSAEFGPRMRLAPLSSIFL